MKTTTVRKAAALLLALLLALMSLAGCKEPQPTAVTLPYNLAEYVIVRPERSSTTLITAVTGLRNDIISRGVDNIDIDEDWLRDGVTDATSGIREILVGNTNRPESAQALEGITDTTVFVITVIGNKIIINGASETVVASGVRYFTDNLLAQTDGGILTLEENYRYTSDSIPTLDIVSGGECHYTVVYLEGLDNTSKSGDDSDRLDPDVVAARKVRTKINDTTGANCKLGTDWVIRGTDPTDAAEILVGATSRKETSEFLNSIGYDQYGYAVIGNKVVVAGWNEATTDLAVNAFCTYIGSQVIKRDSGNTLAILTSTRFVATNKGWLADIPEYEGGTVTGTQDAGYSNLLIYVSDTTADAYRAYLDKLTAAGYTLYMTNNIGDNLHSTYTGSAGMLHVYYTACDNAVRIVTCPDGKYTLPANATAAAAAGYTKITESKITQMSLNYVSGNFGMCYITTLEDGSFIIFDGGGNGHGDDVRLYNLLNELNVRADRKIVIAGWFLTHEHWDHYTVFADFCNKYGSQVKIEAFYCNLASTSVVYNSGNPNYYVAGGFSSTSAQAGGIPLIKIHTGMKFYIRNAAFEVIYTQEDAYPKHISSFNDTTMVTRMTVAGQTVTWLGDIHGIGSAVMCDRYGTLLKSDIVQVSHHGYSGGSSKLYNYLRPDTALWPTSLVNYQKQTSGASRDGYFGVDYQIAHDLGVSTIIVAEPSQTITLPFRAGNTIVTNKY